MWLPTHQRNQEAGSDTRVHLPPILTSPYVSNAVFSRRRQRHPTPVLLPRKSHGRRSLVGCSPWGREESGMTERLYFHFSLSCTGEGNGNPLQCSRLENPRDGEAWRAAVYGVAQSRTRLTRLSSSSSSLLSVYKLTSIYQRLKRATTFYTVLF